MSVIFELAIVRLLIKYPKMDVKCIYIAPNKALCQQKVVEWTKTFGYVGALVVEITGDTALENTMRLVAKSTIIVTTVDIASVWIHGFDNDNNSPRNGTPLLARGQITFFCWVALTCCKYMFL